MFIKKCAYDLVGKNIIKKYAYKCSIYKFTPSITRAFFLVF